MRLQYLLGARLQSEPPLSKAKYIEGPSDGKPEDEVEHLDAQRVAQRDREERKHPVTVLDERTDEEDGERNEPRGEHHHEDHVWSGFGDHPKQAGEEEDPQHMRLDERAHDLLTREEGHDQERSERPQEDPQGVTAQDVDDDMFLQVVFRAR